MTAEGSQRYGNGLGVFGRKHSQKGFLKLIQFSGSANRNLSGVTHAGFW